MDLASLTFCKLTLAFALRQKRLHDVIIFIYFKLRKIRNGRMIMIFVTDALRTAKTGRQIFSKCRADMSHDRNAVRAPVSLRAGLNTTIGLPVGGMMRVATDGTNSSCE